MSVENLEKDITAIVAEVTELEENEIWEKRDADFFKDLEIDSLLALEILALIEKKFKVQIPEEKLVDITSLNATIEMTRSTLEGK
ncbi:MAG: acyl carrier protein [Candidatus Scalindua sp.]|nr:acyl carrier protein [Candidatus Scalindua sp.]MBT5307375.1 acyl carrier protein [Candidatus Scalindua sp.]MBT6048599.1 acyl carrier protein [Candidatus Scalindua sp.]MBT6562027.1 acyl carrier protein [Candidatus Scalindua sp.]MBT7210858.1 acyl carrier protein [Candidatus Scalindua sp.]